MSGLFELMKRDLYSRGGKVEKQSALISDGSSTKPFISNAPATKREEFIQTLVRINAKSPNVKSTFKGKSNDMERMTPLIQADGGAISQDILDMYFQNQERTDMSHAGSNFQDSLQQLFGSAYRTQRDKVNIQDLSPEEIQAQIQTAADGVEVPYTMQEGYVPTPYDRIRFRYNGSQAGLSHPAVTGDVKWGDSQILRASENYHNPILKGLIRGNNVVKSRHLEFLTPYQRQFQQSQPLPEYEYPVDPTKGRYVPRPSPMDQTLSGSSAWQDPNNVSNFDPKTGQILPPPEGSPTMSREELDRMVSGEKQSLNTMTPATYRTPPDLMSYDMPFKAMQHYTPSFQQGEYPIQSENPRVDRYRDPKVSRRMRKMDYSYLTKNQQSGKDEQMLQDTPFSFDHLQDAPIKQSNPMVNDYKEPPKIEDLHQHYDESDPIEVKLEKINNVYKNHYGNVSPKPLVPTMLPNQKPVQPFETVQKPTVELGIAKGKLKPLNVPFRGIIPPIGLPNMIPATFMDTRGKSLEVPPILQDQSNYDALIAKARQKPNLTSEEESIAAAKLMSPRIPSTVKFDSNEVGSEYDFNELEKVAEKSYSNSSREVRTNDNEYMPISSPLKEKVSSKPYIPEIGDKKNSTRTFTKPGEKPKWETLTMPERGVYMLDHIDEFTKGFSQNERDKFIQQTKDKYGADTYPKIRIHTGEVIDNKYYKKR